MSAWLRRILLGATAGAAGVLAYLAWGNGPDPAAAKPRPQAPWQLPAVAAPKLAATDAVWKERPPWGSAPAATGAPKPVAWLPAGIVGQGKDVYAVFVAPGQPEVRVRPGARLPDGGKVLAISRSKLSWVDAQGAKHEHELLADPLPMQ